MKPFYQEKGITIYHADFRDVTPQYPALTFDVVMADPPYGIGETGKKNGTRVTLASPTDYGDFNWDLEPWDGSHFDELRRCSRNQIVWGGNYYTQHLQSSSGWVVWDKDNSGDFADCELAWTSFKCGLRKFKWRWNGMLQEDMKRKEPRWYPTQKPLALLKWLFARYTKPDDFILDPCFGGGGSLIVAKELRMRAIGVDKSEQACEIAAKRLSQEVLQFDTVLSSSESPDPVEWR